MEKSLIQPYICAVCNYLYDDESAEKDHNNAPIPFTQLPEEWRCPICGVSQDQFTITTSDRTPDVPELPNK